MSELENHSHPMLRNRQVPLFQSPPSILHPIPVEEPSGSNNLPEPSVQESEPQSQPVISNPSSPTPSAKPINLPKPKPRPSVVISGIDPSKLVTCILVNFKTKRLTKQALTSFLDYYAPVTVILIDNGSHDDSTNLVRQAGNVYPKVHSVLYDTNIGHGPALHKAIKQIETDYVFTLDSDCIVHRQGFLERMIKRARDENLYALGWRRWVDNRSGVPLEWHAHGVPNKDKFIPYIHPCAGLYDVSMYRQLYPFVHHGAPCVKNMLEAHKRGYKVAPFPIFDYIEHLKAGTRRMYQGRWNPRTSDRPGPWNDDMDWPI